MTDDSCTLRSRPKWARRRAPEKGALLERWLAQCGRTSSTIHHRVIARIRRRTGYPRYVLPNECCSSLAAVVVSDVIVATAALAELFDEPDSRPHRSRNSANSCSRPESSRSRRLTSTCRTDSTVATLQLFRSEPFDRRLDRNSSSCRPGYWLRRGLVTGMAAGL